MIGVTFTKTVTIIYCVNYWLIGINKVTLIAIMKAYYIHWTYPTTADDSLYYGGDDDDKLFHHRENAEKRAKELIDYYAGKQQCLNELFAKHMAHETTTQEDEEYYDMIGYSDTPNGYSILERDIVFEDEPW